MLRFTFFIPEGFLAELIFDFFLGGLPTLEPYVPLPYGMVISYHFDLFAQYAADILPLAMFLAWRALNDLRLAFCLAVFGLLPAPDTPC